jgi:hypothetical protein
MFIVVSFIPFLSVFINYTIYGDYMLRRVIAFLIVFTMVFEQSGFAQVAGPIGVPVYLQNLVTIADRYRPVHLRAIGLEAIAPMSG